MPFLTKLKGAFIDNEELFELSAPLKYVRASGQTYTVPAGTRTDFASFPRFFGWLFSKIGKSRKPAVLHDYLYKTANENKEVSDWIFFEALREQGMCWLKAKLMYWAVRDFGHFAWRKHRDND